MWYLYLLLCDGKTFYVGITNNLEKRLSEHRDKKSLFTKRFSDVEMVYIENYNNKYDAAKRERQLKGWSSLKKQMLIDGRL